MNPRRTSLRSTIDALSQALADAVLLVVRRTPLAELGELGGALDPAPARAIARPAAPEAARAPRRAEASPPSPAARSPRARRVRPVAARRQSQLELPLDPPNAYPEATIVDPAAVLGRPQPPQNASGAPIVSADEAESLRASPAAPALAPPAPAAARPTTRLRPGEEFLRAAGGGVVLRRRRSAPNPAP